MAEPRIQGPEPGKRRGVVAGLLRAFRVVALLDLVLGAVLLLYASLGHFSMNVLRGGLLLAVLGVLGLWRAKWWLRKLEASA